MANVDCLFLLEFETAAGMAASSSEVKVAEMVSSAGVDAVDKSGVVLCGASHGKPAAAEIKTLL